MKKENALYEKIIKSAYIVFEKYKGHRKLHDDDPDFSHMKILTKNRKKLNEDNLEIVLLHLYPWRFSDDLGCFRELCYFMPRILKEYLSDEHIMKPDFYDFFEFMLHKRMVDWRNYWPSEEIDIILKVIKKVFEERIKRLDYIDKQIFGFHLLWYKNLKQFKIPEYCSQKAKRDFFEGLLECVKVSEKGRFPLLCVVFRAYGTHWDEIRKKDILDIKLKPIDKKWRLIGLCSADFDKYFTEEEISNLSNQILDFVRSN